MGYPCRSFIDFYLDKKGEEYSFSRKRGDEFLSKKLGGQIHGCVKLAFSYLYLGLLLEEIKKGGE